MTVLQRELTASATGTLTVLAVLLAEFLLTNARLLVVGVNASFVLLASLPVGAVRDGLASLLRSLVTSFLVLDALLESFVALLHALAAT